MMPDFQKLFEAVPGSYLVLSPDLKIAAVSNAYLKATSTRRDDIVGMDLFRVLPDNPNDPAAMGAANLKASLNRVLKTKAPDAMAIQRYDLQNSEGTFEEKFWSMLNSPVLGTNGEVAFIIHRMEDMTEFMRLKKEGSKNAHSPEELKNQVAQVEHEVYLRAQQLQEANQKLREAERAKSDFFASISHELRTPLSLILAPLESLLSAQYGGMSETQAELIQTIHNNAIRLLQMVNGLLDFAKLEAGKMKVSPEPTDIVALIHSVMKDFEPMITGKKIELSWDLEPPAGYIMIDRYLFERILFNLLSNAVKFTRSGGKITVGLETNEDKLQLYVEDTGVGISAADKEKLFQKFYQSEAPSSKRYEGNKLGLAMAKEFAELMGGAISVKSSVGRGSSFLVEIPVVPANAVPSRNYDVAQRAALVPQYSPGTSRKESDKNTKNTGSQMKVLVCEDNGELAVYITSLLRDFCRVKVARDGDEALNIVKTWKPDLVLTDLIMPKIDGIELCKEIKSNPATANIIVVLLTALTHRAAMIKGWEAKVDDYLFKPFHPNELVSRIQSLLSLRKDRQMAMEAIEKKDDELMRTNSELEAFTFNVSHDLRSPLRSISRFAQKLLDDYNDVIDESGKNYLGKINKSASRANQLIDDLLNFSLTASTEMSKKMVDMNQLVENVVDDMQSDEKDYNINFKISKLPSAVCDPQLVKQVWTNLISNAVKYSKNQDKPVVEIGSREVGGQTAYYVKDNGVGFDMKYVHKLFTAFQRLHSQSDFEGTGLGLALVNRIVTRHGGKAWAEGKENKGATFYFTLSESTEDGAKEEGLQS